MLFPYVLFPLVYPVVECSAHRFGFTRLVSFSSYVAKIEDARFRPAASYVLTLTLVPRKYVGG